MALIMFLFISSQAQQERDGPLIPYVPPSSISCCQPPVYPNALLLLHTYLCYALWLAAEQMAGHRRYALRSGIGG